VVDVVTNGKGVMPAYRDRLTPEQIEHLAGFVSTAAGSE
jgi:mono/diheme cytochrome c family protein